MRFRLITLCAFLATLGVTVYLAIIIPKGFVPTQDTGIIVAITQGSQDVSFAEMSQRQMALAKVVGEDPDVQAYSSSIGAGLGGQTGNNGRIYISLKPWDERHSNAQQIIARLAKQATAVPGAQLFMPAGQDINIGGRLAKTQYQFILQDADISELYQWAPKIQDKLRSLSALRDLATDQQMAGATATLTTDRE